MNANGKADPEEPAVLPPGNPPTSSRDRIAQPVLTIGIGDMKETSEPARSMTSIDHILPFGRPSVSLVLFVPWAANSNAELSDALGTLIQSHPVLCFLDHDSVDPYARRELERSTAT